MMAQLRDRKKGGEAQGRAMPKMLSFWTLHMLIL